MDNTKGIDKTKVLLFLFLANIIPYLYPLIQFYLIGISEGNEYMITLIYLYILPIFIPWTLLILLFTSIINTIIDNNIEKTSIKLNIYLSVLSLVMQVLAPIILIVFMSSVYLYHFLMLISLILILLAYYRVYKNNITKQIEVNKTQKY
jgi:hypothetical protein